MLIPKPLILILKHKKEKESQARDSHKKEQKDESSEEDEETKYHKLDDEEEDEGEEAKDKVQKESIIPKKNAKVGGHHEYEELPDSKEADVSIEFKKKSEIINDSGDHPHSSSEIFIHQLIETIEYVLGCISNTASYLRLWALSLAHSQLAGVFFELVLWSGIKNENPIAIFIGFLIFGSATFAVLMCMDLMECFLHTLRLHWVEFQNKFYKGGGTLFQPLNFESVHQK